MYINKHTHSYTHTYTHTHTHTHTHTFTFMHTHAQGETTHIALSSCTGQHVLILSSVSTPFPCTDQRVLILSSSPCTDQHVPSADCSHTRRRRPVTASTKLIRNGPVPLQQTNGTCQRQRRQQLESDTDGRATRVGIRKPSGSQSHVRRTQQRLVGHPRWWRTERRGK